MEKHCGSVFVLLEKNLIPIFCDLEIQFFPIIEYFKFLKNQLFLLEKKEHKETPNVSL